MYIYNTCIHVHANIRTCIYIYNMYICVNITHMCAHNYVDLCTDRGTYIGKQVCIYIRVHICIHICAYTLDEYFGQPPL